MDLVSFSGRLADAHLIQNVIRWFPSPTTDHAFARFDRGRSPKSRNGNFSRKTNTKVSLLEKRSIIRAEISGQEFLTNGLWVLQVEQLDICHERINEAGAFRPILPRNRILLN